MKLEEFDYELDKNLIAQEPVRPRDHSRLLVLSSQNGNINHDRFYNIINYLNKGDILVLNNSKVFPARLRGKRETGGKVEIFLLHQKNSNTWYGLIGGKKLQEQEVISFSEGLSGEVSFKTKDSQATVLIKFNLKGRELMDTIKQVGEVPLPPYIKRQAQEQDKYKYQTVYARDNKLGSVAAPTAGFHFTQELLDKLKHKGVIIKYVTLHVSLGTFAPVKTQQIEHHDMHSEFLEVTKEVANLLFRAKRNKQRIVAVGTTSVRSIETLFQEKQDKKFLKKDFSTWSNIFIYPGYKFQGVDAMITNFHLPKSTLLMLVSAFAGKDKIFTAYQEAKQKQYRFYSYGDAMFIIPARKPHAF